MFFNILTFEIYKNTDPIELLAAETVTYQNKNTVSLTFLANTGSTPKLVQIFNADPTATTTANNFHLKSFTLTQEAGTPRSFGAVVSAYYDYYPFGMQMPGRKTTNSDGYRYGFNGHENDNEVKGVGNHISFGDYGMDPRLGRRWNIDPQWQRVPGQSPYSVNHNSPIQYTDPDGKFGVIILGAIGGALAGAAIEFGKQVASNVSEKGFSLKAFTDVDVKKIGGAAAEGLITGAVVGATGGLSIIAAAGAQAGASVVGGIAKRTIAGEEVFDTKEVLTDIVAGGVGGAFGQVVGRKLSGTVTATILGKQAVKNAPAIVRGIGKFLVRKGGELFDNESSAEPGIGTVPASSVDPDGNLKKGTTIKIVEPLKEVVITPDKDSDE